jgi:hypothetical protein
MGKSTRRIIGVAAAALLLGAAAIGAQQLDKMRGEQVRAAQAAAGEQARDQVVELLGQRLQQIQSRAESAGSLPELRAQVGVVDWYTLRDGFASEPWWLPVRRDATIYGLSVESEGLDNVEGVERDALGPQVSDLLQKAREKRSASGVRLVGGRPMLLAAAQIDKPGRKVAPVLVLGKPLDDELVDALAGRIKGAVLLTDGKHEVAGSGAPSARAKLTQAMGSEAAAPGDAHRGYALVATLLAPGLWLWVNPPPPEVAANNASALLWAGAGLLALGALVFGFFPSREQPAGDYPEDEPQEEPAPVARSQPGRGTGRTSAGPARAGAGSGRTGTGRAGSSGQTAAARPKKGATDPNAKSRTDPTRRTASAASAAAAADQGEPEGTQAGMPTFEQTSEDEPVDPNQFGRYLLLDRLGEGGMAEVFTAVAHGAEGFRRHFVVKRLRGQLAGRQDVVNMFIDEARLASSFVHSNIIPVFDFGKVGEEYYMATEYILGRDLGRVSRRAMEVDGTGLAAPFALYCIRETLRALEYAHSKTDDEGNPQNIVHRDISPNNILVSARGEVKLFDFGIAKAEGRLTETQAGTVKGNIRFMSSEQAYGNAVDQRSDLASVGLSLYYVLAGDALYEGTTQYELIIKAAQGCGDKEKAKLAVLAPELQALLLKAIEPSPDKRFQNATEFLHAVEKLKLADSRALQAEMDRLFGDDLKAEKQKLQLQTRGSGSSGESRAPRTGG